MAAQVCGRAGTWQVGVGNGPIPELWCPGTLPLIPTTLRSLPSPLIFVPLWDWPVYWSAAPLIWATIVASQTPLWVGTDIADHPGREQCPPAFGTRRLLEGAAPSWHSTWEFLSPSWGFGCSNNPSFSPLCISPEVQQSSFYGYTGLLPKRYTQGVMTGESKYPHPTSWTCTFSCAPVSHTWVPTGPSIAQQVRDTPGCSPANPGSSLISESLHCHARLVGGMSVRSFITPKSLLVAPLCWEASHPHGGGDEDP